MDLRFHTYRGDVDYRRIRELLIACRAGSTGCECWGLDRWEGVRYHGHIQAELVGNHDWYQAIGLWEERDGRLVAALIPESPGEVYPQVLPELRADRSLPDEMLRFAEDYRRAECPAGSADSRLDVYAAPRHLALTSVLRERGYVDRGPAEVLRWRRLSAPAPTPALPDGYQTRELRIHDRDDLDRYCDVEQATFRRARWTPETVRLNSQALTYRPDLDLVVVAPDGSHAAFTTVWHDAGNRVGYFEPVGTHPDHRRRGLALALLNEGFRRLIALGAETAFVGTGYASPANRLYEAAGFAGFSVANQWRLPLGHPGR